MSDVISESSIISSLRDHNVKLIIVGALIDLKMQNGWVKQDEFVSIEYNESVSVLESLRCCGDNDFEFTSKLVDANNDVREVTVRGRANSYAANYGSPDIKLPNITDISASVSGCGLTCSNVRLVTHVSIGCQVIGVDYANGDFLKKNVRDFSMPNMYR